MEIEITQDLIDKEEIPPLKNIYQRLFDFKNEKALDKVVQTKASLVWCFEIFPSIPEVEVDKISNEIDDMIDELSAYWNRNTIKEGHYCAVVTNG